MRSIAKHMPGSHRVVMLIVALAVVAGMGAVLAPSAGAAGFIPISGSGSTWASNAIDQWRRNVASQFGITVNYAPNGSTSGRNDFRAGQVDFAVSEIPYGLTDGGVFDPPPRRAFGYLPVVAGGLSFMYNLKIGGKRVTNLRLSGETIALIFTQQITNWSDPAIKADNPGLVLPARSIVPVVHSEGSGATAQFTAFLASRYPALWDDYCHRAGRMITPCGFSSFFPVTGTTLAKAQSQGVAGFVAQDSSEGAITYVELSYARNAGFPAAKMLNAANYYVEPTAASVAIALLAAKLNVDLTQDLSQVYVNSDPRAYPLSSYSYMIVPKDTTANFTTEKGRTLSEFAYYFLCEGQQQADVLGYSPLPLNLVQAGIDQAGQIPGSTHKLDRNNLAGCHNPTFSPDGTNLLVTNAPQPASCDRKGAPTQCSAGTGGAPGPFPPPGPPPTLPPGPPPIPLPAPGGGGPPVDSAVTVSGSGAFANLKVTVSQTRNLRNQAVGVSWTGAAPTVPAGGQFRINYLQIMQCWGDDPAGPDRTQCQYGGQATQSVPAGGSWVRSRQVTYGAGLLDPKETLRPAPGTQNAFAPFWAAGRDKPTGAATSNGNDFFDSQVTNEIPLARTRADGTGQESFEVETVRQAAGLGCGEPVTTGGATRGRACWLVIVPRGSAEVDGSVHTGASDTDRLDSSPLSQGNWDNRIVIPLEFLPVDQPCPVGAPERPVIGHEFAAEAVGSWQPALCAGGGALYSYTQLPDDVARSQVLDAAGPGLALTTSPVLPEQVPVGHPLVYAPVGLSGLAIAFVIDHQPPANGRPDALGLAGSPFTSMKLTPRLVAKLLTQSYQGAVVGAPEYLKRNPAGLTRDPEFLVLNPDYQGFTEVTTPPDALVPLNGSDLTSLLWSWVVADPDARAFLAGTPDQFGMVVNPNNKDLTLPTSIFPRNDQTCVDTDLGNGVRGRDCTLDEHPFATDMHEAARSASRGDTLGRKLALGPDGTSPVAQRVERQVPGQRALIAVVDTATAARYGLPTASLRNAAGQFVAPTTPGLLAGAAAMKPSAVPGVRSADPAAADPGSYPLAALSYAISAPSALDAAAARDYAAFLRYAVGPGQQPGGPPGGLPFGMTPLPDPLKAQTLAAAATIEAQTGAPAPPTGAVTTTVTLTVAPDSASAGIPVFLTATVSPPAAIGTVQFMDGSSALGAPVPVFGGTAFLAATTLAVGTHSLTAVFTPTRAQDWGPSSAPPVSLLVRPGPLQAFFAGLQSLLDSIFRGLHP